MIADIFAVAWKEWRELYQQLSTRGGIFGWLIMVLLVGILMPLQTGKDWVASPYPMLAWSWPPLLRVIVIVTDSFAGERERHTLETLLASRLPDRAILFGKLATAAAYGWSMELASLLLSLVTVNVAFGRSELLLFPPQWVAAILAISLASIVLVCALGILVSLRSATARAAYQKVSIFIFALAVLPSLALIVLPEGFRGAFLGNLRLAPGAGTIAFIAAVFTLADVVLLAYTLARFQRSRLILD